jgi:hypothetical protein
MAKNTKGPTPDEVYQQLRPTIGDHDHEAVITVLRGALACPECGGALMRSCPACQGRTGGRKVTKAKLRQLKNAAKRPRPGRRKP